MDEFEANIENALDVLFEVEKQLPQKNSLFGKDKIVYLQVVLFKIPYTAPRKRKFVKLCHSLYGDDPEICLFVPNRKTDVEYKKTTDELIDYCVDYYTELLEKHRVKGIKAVMPLKQLRSEYGTYDLKRKLTRRFDLFLCKNSLLYNYRFLSSLGKIFRVANKEPLGVSFPKENVDFDPKFQKNIERAIYTSSFFITRFSDNYSIPFGVLSHTKAELKDNLIKVLKQILNKNFIPGGCKNIRSMNIWPSQSKPIPLYVNPKIPYSMKTPCLRSAKRKRKLQGVEGELSTQPSKKVFVMPNGDVFVSKIKKKNFLPEAYESEDDDSFKDDSDSEEESKVKKKDSKAKISAPENGKSESEDDEEIEEKEAKLMRLKVKTEGQFHSADKPSKGSEDENKDMSVSLRRKQKKKFSENFINKNSNEEKSAEKKKPKSITKDKGQRENKKKVNTAKRKTEMKQEKFKRKENLNLKLKKKKLKPNQTKAL